MAAKLTRQTHKIAIQLHLVADSCTICSSRSRRPVRKLLDTPSYNRRFNIACHSVRSWTRATQLSVSQSTLFSRRNAPVNISVKSRLSKKTSKQNSVRNFVPSLNYTSNPVYFVLSVRWLVGFQVCNTLSPTQSRVHLHISLQQRIFICFAEPVCPAGLITSKNYYVNRAHIILSFLFFFCWISKEDLRKAHPFQYLHANIS
jgi:hypothetical protein